MKKISGADFGVAKAVALALFLLIQVYLIFIRRHESLDIDVFPGTDPAPHIYQDNRVGQTFVAQRDNLTRIDVVMGTYDRKNDRDVTFRLREVQPERKLVAEKTFNASQVKNNLYYAIRFDPVKDSKGKKYYCIFNSPQSTYRNSVSIWMNRKNIYPEGNYFFRQAPEQGDLVFRVYSQRPVFSELGRIVRHYSGIFGSRVFLILAILFFESAQIFFLIKLVDFVFGSLKSS